MESNEQQARPVQAGQPVRLQWVRHVKKDGTVKFKARPDESGDNRPRGKSWRWHFDHLVKTHYGIKREGAGGFTSYRTREYMLETTFLLMDVLRGELGMKIVKPKNFDPRHALALAGWINKQYHDGKRQPATLAGYATTVRHLLRWADRARLVELFDAELDPKSVSRELATDRDKSWEGQGVSFEDAFGKAWAVEPWVALCLAAQEAFGLRRREAVMLRPLVDIDLEGETIHLVVGAKGGRPRLIPIQHRSQQELARQLQTYVQARSLRLRVPAGSEGSLADPNLSLAQAVKRYANVMAAIGFTKSEAGVTGHGLRAGYVCRRLIELGITPVVRGGDGRHPDPRQDEIAQRIVTEAVGHSRKVVLGAYAGSLHTRERLRSINELRRRGWVVPGESAEAVKENVRRRDAFLADPQAFGAWIAAQADHRLARGEDHAG